MFENFIDDVLKEQYSLVNVLKNTDKTKLFVYRHKELETRIVKRVIKGDGEAYISLKKLSHPNIANIYDAVADKGEVVILEEFIDGMTVFEYLQDGLFSPLGVKRVVSALCDALSFLHSNNIIHKDIKPENVMIDNNGDVKLIDFDAARIYKLSQSRDTVMLGTTGYAAPEQYGTGQTDERTDIYALGVLMNVMLTGEPPERELYCGKLKRVILKCTQTIPDNRYQNVSELKNSLKQIRTEQPKVIKKFKDKIYRKNHRNCADSTG